MQWHTRMTELLGCRYPILQGAFAGFGNWRFAAAVAETGAHGMITASFSRKPETLRDDIKRCRDATGGTFGVNLSIGACPQIDYMLDVCIESGVQVETAMNKPDELAPRIKAGGLKWVHKAARVKDALHAEKLGADAVILVGLEGAGIKNPEQLPTMTTTILAARHLAIPVIAAGGIGDARGFLGALGMGADGIMMGTAFMAATECPARDAAKDAIIRTSPDDPRLRQRVLAVRDREKEEEVLKEVMAMRGKLSHEDWMDYYMRRVKPGTSGDEVMAGGTRSEGSAGAGSMAVGVIDRILTARELVDGIIEDAEEILKGWQFLSTR